MGWLNKAAAGVWGVAGGVRQFFASDERDAADDFWYGPIGTRSAADVHVTPVRAMQASVVYASVRVLAETLASLPLHMHRRRPDGGREVAENHPINDLLHDRPNSYQTSLEWREMLQAHLALRGNAYSEIIPGPRGPVDQLIPMHPDTVEARKLENGRIAFRVTREGGAQEVLTQDEVFHVKGLAWDGVTGLDPISAAMREPIGVALGAQQFSGRFLANDARPSGVIEFPGRFKSTEDQQEFRKSWQEAQTGWNFGKAAVLPQGMQWKEVQMSNRQAQFLEQRKYSDVEIARLFRVPPHMVAILDRATFSNIEQQAIDFVVHTLMPWIVRWEQAITTQLVLAPQTFFPKFNVGGLLRGDMETRNAAYAIGRQWGWLSANDVRRLEDMNPIPGGDVYISPMNMMPADQVGAPPAGLAALADAAAERVLRKELIACERAYRRHMEDVAGFDAWAEDFYRAHAGLIRSTLRVGDNVAGHYAAGRLTELRAAIDDDGIYGVEDVLRAWSEQGSAPLAALCVEALQND